MTSPPLIPRQPLAVDFMNTIWADRDGVHDTLASPDGLLEWLGAASGSGHLAGGDPALDRPARDGPVLDRVVLDRVVLDAPVMEQFRDLRDALRVLAAEITGDTRPVAGPPPRDVPRAVGTVNRCCAAAPSWSQLTWPPSGAPARRLVTTAAPADAVLARLAEAGAALFGSDQATKLAACRAPGCVLYFAREHPRRQWCSDGCGNRARVARHYARHHG